MERRRFVATAAAVATAGVAGCSGGTDHSLAGGAFEDANREEESESVTLTTTIAIPEGEYAARQYSLDDDRQFGMTFDVVSGGPIDAFFLNRREYDERYRDGGDDLQYFNDLSAPESDGESLSGVVEAGEYTLVFDNTGGYGASPDGEATVEVEIVRSVPAGQHIESAWETVDEAGSVIEQQAGGDGQSFDADRVHARLDDAEADLDAAEATATESQQSEIESVRAVVAWFRSIADAMVAIDDGLSAFETANSYFQSERYDDSRERLDDAEADFETGGEAVETAREEFEAIDDDTLDEYGVATAESAMNELASLADSMIAFTGGLRDLITGLEAFDEGATAFDEERWNDAIDSFESAQEASASAESTFQDNEDDVHQGMSASAVEMTCLAGAMEESAGHFASAASAARNGRNSQAVDEAEKGQAALDRCE